MFCFTEQNKKNVPLNKQIYILTIIYLNSTNADLWNAKSIFLYLQPAELE